MNARAAWVAAGVVAFFSAAASAKEYSFVVENHTGVKITKIQASEDGKHWGEFDVGKGIAGHGKMKLVWDESTNSSNCEWQVRATYADGSQSDPAPFDFCEDDLVLEFDE